MDFLRNFVFCNLINLQKKGASMAMLEFLAFASWHYVAYMKGGTNPSTKASEGAQNSQCSKYRSVSCPEYSLPQSKVKGRKKTSATDLSLAVTKFMNKMIPFVFNAYRDDIKKAHDEVETKALEEAWIISSNILKIAKETKALDSKANELDFLSTKYFIFEETLMQKATTALVKIVGVDVSETEKIATFAEEMSKIVTDFLLKMFDKSKDRILIDSMVEAIETARDGILFKYLALRFFDIVVLIKMQLGIVDSSVSKKKNKKKN